MTYSPLKYDKYEYPDWGMAIGWLLTVSSLIFIPGVMIYKLISMTGTIREVNIYYPKGTHGYKKGNFRLKKGDKKGGWGRWRLPCKVESLLPVFFVKKRINQLSLGQCRTQCKDHHEKLVKRKRPYRGVPALTRKTQMRTRISRLYIMIIFFHLMGYNTEEEIRTHI